jgi:hypothetical protein
MHAVDKFECFYKESEDVTISKYDLCEGYNWCLLASVNISRFINLHRNYVEVVLFAQQSVPATSKAEPMAKDSC